jgi:hypothetical protein
VLNLAVIQPTDMSGYVSVYADQNPDGSAVTDPDTSNLYSSTEENDPEPRELLTRRVGLDEQLQRCRVLLRQLTDRLIVRVLDLYDGR